LILDHSSSRVAFMVALKICRFSDLVLASVYMVS